MTGNNALTVESRGPVLVATINRVKAHNALNAEVLSGLAEAVDRAEADPGIHALIVTGAGEKAFCAGADLRELSSMNSDEAHRTIGRGQQVMSKIETAEVPIIAAVNGLALGGGFELALAAHFAVLSETASLGLPETGLGLIPGYGGTQRLPRAVGDSTAIYCMVTGENLSSARAYELGLTPLRPTAQTDVVDTALAVANKIAGQGPTAVRSVLLAVRIERAMSASSRAAETGLAALAIAGEESTEGITAFLEKRPAEFNKSEGER